MHTNIVKQLHQLYKSYTGNDADRIEMLPQSGSDRIYFRLYDGETSCVATYNTNIPENRTFLYFTQHFREKGIAVPEILIVSEDEKMYLQSDLGNQTLLNVLEAEGPTDRVFNLFKKSVQQLALLQIKGDEGLDYSRCLTAKEFGKQAILSDLLYFKYYFLDALKMAYDKQALMADFEKVASALSTASDCYFMFRDFQSRNIMVKDDEVYFIDYQGGMKGAMQYDLASLLWQAKAQLSAEWKRKLEMEYVAAAEALLMRELDKDAFFRQYHGFVLIRLLQVLGAYGFRGFFQRKAHFLSSIPQALQNLKQFLDSSSAVFDTDVFYRVLQQITSEENMQLFQPIKAGKNSALLIKVGSFSYKKSIPEDASGNGGGFVFDCRGIFNPGRLAEYKYASGKDKSVIDFLEQQTRMNEFLNSAFDVVDITVEEYIKRDFSSLMISFGCTGGQHRSVYAAEQMARHLRNKYNANVEVVHHNQTNWPTPENDAE